MKDNPIISIIVPVYNAENYLHRCIKSILNQTFKDFELILVNDGSTDKSGFICDEYKKLDDRVVVIHKENEGAAIARNLGLDIAKGKYIGFVDSDDYISKNMYYELYNSLIKNNSDIAICKYKEFTDEREVINNKNNLKHIKNFNNIEALENYFLNYGHKERIMHTIVWDKLYKRELFNEIRFPNVSFAEDGYVVYKLLYFSKNITFVDSILYYYFQRNESLSKTKFSNKWLEAYRDRKEIFDFMYKENKHLAKLSAKSYIDKYILTYSQLLMYKTIEGNKLYREIIKNDLKNDLRIFKDLNVDRYYIIKVTLFNYNYKVLAIFERINNLIYFINNKIYKIKKEDKKWLKYQ